MTQPAARPEPMTQPAAGPEPMSAWAAAGRDVVAVGEDDPVLAAATPDVELAYHPPHALDLRRTLAPLSRGRADPTSRVDANGAWRTAATPAGPGLLRLRRDGDGVVHAAAWGPGADWLAAGVPELLGARDRPEEFSCGHPFVRDVARRLPGMRFPRCRLVFEMLAGAVLEQKVTGLEARASWAALVRWHGTTAPGPAPAGMRVAPTAEVWRRIPSWDWHRAGVDGKRSRTVLAAARVAGQLERTLELGQEAAEAVLRTVPGVGIWTAAEVLQRAHGVADAVSYGDFHIPANVGWALLGRPVDDDGLRDLLAPWAGHRGRVVRLVEASGFRKPRFGPRYRGLDHRDR